MLRLCSGDILVGAELAVFWLGHMRGTLGVRRLGVQSAWWVLFVLGR